MKNKKTISVCIACCVFSFVVMLFLFKASYAEGISAAAQSSITDKPACAAKAREVDEHAGHNHAQVKEHKQQIDEHAGHNHAPNEKQKDNK